jgi:hypothetical protein
MSRSAITKLWEDMQHGDVKHQEWLRDQLIRWAEAEFSIKMGEWSFPIQKTKYYKERGH